MRSLAVSNRGMCASPSRGHAYLFPDPSGRRRRGRHGNKVDALRRRRRRLLQIVVALRTQLTQRHTCAARHREDAKYIQQEECRSIILPTQPDLERLVALITPQLFTVNLACVCVLVHSPLRWSGQQWPEANTCRGGDFQGFQNNTIYQQHWCVCVWTRC